MSSVTSGVKGLKNIPKWDFKSSVKVEKLKAIGELHDFDAISLDPARIGVVIDYFSRLLISGDFYKSFITSERAFSFLYALKVGDIPPSEYVASYEEKQLIEDAFPDYSAFYYAFSRYKKSGQKLFDDDEFVDIAIRLTAFDTYFRSSKVVLPEEIKVDKKSIENVRVLVRRIVNFLNKKDKKIICGSAITAFTEQITSGDGDFLTTQSLIDIKSYKNDPSTKEHGLQLLVYFLLAKEADDFRFKKVKDLVIFNPRTNLVYTLEVKDIPREVIEYIKSKWGRITRIVSRKEIEEGELENIGQHV